MRKIIFEGKERDTFYDGENFIPFVKSLGAEEVGGWESGRVTTENEYGPHHTDYFSYVYLLAERSTVIVFMASLESFTRKSSFHSEGSVTLVGNEEQVNELERLLLEEASKFQPKLLPTG